MPGAHAHKSPSTAKRLHACRGSLALIDSLPDREKVGAGRAAQMGTAAHHLLEHCLSAQEHPEAYHGRIIELLGPDGDEGCRILSPRAKTPKNGVIWFEADDAMVEGVSLAYNYVLRRCDELSVDPKTIALEQRTNPVPDRDDTSGTADVSIDGWPTVLEVVDYKNGYMTVEHEDNEQLLAYLTGRAHDFGWVHDLYRITVVQPNAAHEEGRVRSMNATEADLKAFVDRHRAVCEEADQAIDELDIVEGPLAKTATEYLDECSAPMVWADRWLTAGPHCSSTMCDAQLTCPAAKAWRRAQTAVEFDDDPLGEKDAKPPEAVQEAARILGWAPYIKSVIKLAEAMASKALREGTGEGVVKLIRSRGKRGWKSDLGTPYEVASKLVKAGVISDNERPLLFTEPELLTGPKVEKLIKGKGAGKRKQQFAEEFLDYVPGGLKVVPASSPGTAVDVAPGAGFEDDLDEE